MASKLHLARISVQVAVRATFYLVRLVHNFPLDDTKEIEAFSSPY